MKQGDTVGNYRIVRLLGTGGMGEVYEVEHVTLGVRYALKTFTLNHGDADFLKERFIAEGRTLARLGHPGIARVFDLGVMPDGTAYFAMDLVLDSDGEPRTLADITPGELDGAVCLRWLESIASVFDFIHAEGIVHRDVKASNMLVNAQNDLILVDFGISRYEHGRIKREIGVEKTVVLGADECAKRVLMGTGGYLAPELSSGGEASAASDVYALGVTFFRLLTGLWYEPGTDALRLLEPLEGPWPRILPPMLDEDPAKRPVKLVEFIKTARMDAVRPRKALLPRLAFACAVFAAAAAGVWLFHQTRPVPPARPVPRPIVFDLGDGSSLEMIECRDQDGRLFWIGASHITNAEWRRVTGCGRDGADDSPAVGMSIGDIDKFIAEINRRFAAYLPEGARFRLPATNELVVASTAGGANAADLSVLGILGPSLADKKALAKKSGVQWEGIMAKLPCRVRTKPPNAWGIYDIVGQGRTICRETAAAPDGERCHVQLGPDDMSVSSLAGKWGWNSTFRLALGKE